MNDWWLKVQRAEKHMVDINQAAIRYASCNPYSFTRIRLPDPQDTIKYRFNITEQPDPMIAVMLGDFIHNLRSALDYIVVASVPKERIYDASFPILWKDIFIKDRSGYMVNNSRTGKYFTKATEGLHPKARAYIISLQPYCHGADSHRYILGILNRLENADKHRQLLTIGCGGGDFSVSFSVSRLTETFRLNGLLAPGSDYFDNNTVIPIPYPEESLIPPSKVDMHFSGTTKILVNVASREGNHPPDNFLLDSLMESALAAVRYIITRLEFFVRKN